MSLQELRKRAGLTQAEVALRMGVSQPYVTELEKRDVRRMQVGTVRRFATACGYELHLQVQFPDGQIVRLV